MYFDFDTIKIIYKQLEEKKAFFLLFLTRVKITFNYMRILAVT